MARNVSIKAPRQYTRSYSDFVGVELGISGGTAPTRRLAYSENMYRDYGSEEANLIESIPGYRRLTTFDGAVHEIYGQRIGDGLDCLLVHAGTGLYRIPLANLDTYVQPRRIADMPETPVCFFSRGTDVYVTTGSDVIKVDKNGTALSIKAHPEIPYAPTVYLNGEPYEQRNLATNRFREEYVVTDTYEYARGDSHLMYKVIDHDLCLCAVAGINPGAVGTVYVPLKANLRGKKFRVTKILDYAFSGCDQATAIHIADGIEEIGRMAFLSAEQVKRIVIPRSVTKIGEKAFSGCSSLEELYLGAGLTEIGESPFINCSAIKKIYYGGSRDMLTAVSGSSAITGYSISYSTEWTKCALRLPLTAKTDSVSAVKENGRSLSFEVEIGGEGVSGVYIEISTSSGRASDIVIEGTLAPISKKFGTDTQIDGFEAIAGARCAELFDGRVFLGGNPSLPNTVFYTSLTQRKEDEMLYFGVESFFNDGVGRYAVEAMLAVRDSLAVFKAGDDGTGSIFYHVPKETDDEYIPKIYPVAYVHSGVRTYGGACSFFDDPIFISDEGVCALTQKAINYERSVACRSHNVNLSLLKEDLHTLRLTKWCGYLAVCGRGNIYLADSRAAFVGADGNAEYEWFILGGIGSYENSTRVYRYDSYEVDGYVANEHPGEICEEVVYSALDSHARTVYYASVGDKKYTLYPTDEMRGGIFHPATAYFGTDKLLFFGTDEGALLVFNNDKRGVPPRHVSEAADFDAEEYERRYGSSIHPYYYAFDNHSPHYAIRTARDDCGIPHLTKSTVKHSLVVKCKGHSSSEICFEVGTDRKGYKEIARFPDSELCFAELNFESMALCTEDYYTLPVSEHEKKWVEKEISIYSDKYASPIGIYSITYRYTPTDRIKTH